MSGETHDGERRHWPTLDDFIEAVSGMALTERQRAIVAELINEPPVIVVDKSNANR